MIFKPDLFVGLSRPEEIAGVANLVLLEWLARSPKVFGQDNHGLPEAWFPPVFNTENETMGYTHMATLVNIKRI